jgi:hypothetical protein
VATDPRRLRPTELARLLNSTPLGEVISERQLHRHRTRAGLRIGDGRYIDLLRYTAWLVQVRHAPKPEPAGDPYEKLKERARSRNIALSLAGRDIGELPDPVDPVRRAKAGTDFRLFCDSYFPLTFHLRWSPDHLKVIRRIEQAVLRGGLFAMAMPRGSGKALAVDTPLPTPFGWTTMGEVGPGDLVLDEEGWPCRVTAATEVMDGRPCFRVDFSDGESIVCDAEHLWTVDDRYSRRNPLTLTTAQLRDRVLLPSPRPWAEHRYRVRMTRPLRLPEAPLEIDPYVLGYWLGDGTRSNNTITVHVDDAQEVADEIRGCGENCEFRNYDGRSNAATYTVGKGHKADPDKTRRVRRALAALSCRVPVDLAASWSGLTEKTVAAMSSLGRWESVRCGGRSSLQVRLAHLGVLNNKHIPAAYLRAAPWQRLALLQGLMDTDGSVRDDGGACEITLKDDRLGRDLGDLLSGLGFRWKQTVRHVELNGRRFGPYLRYTFTAHCEFPVFRLARKRRRLPPTPAAGGATDHRQITAVEPVPSVPVRCIQVDSPSGLYLAGRKMVPTHNSTICECACIWAVLYGHREFVCLIGSDEGHAMDMLESIKMELDGNEALAGDFPDAIHPIQCLDGIANRAGGQLYKGERTHIGWTAKEIVLPTLKPAGWPEREDVRPFVRPDGYSRASGAIIKVAGITGRIRGMKYKRADGHTVRPTLVVLDDPQTDESARSLSQCATRESILAGAVLGLAGPGNKISGIMPCTVIRPGDMADNILSRDRHPEWNGERTKMVYSFPADEKLWQRYAEIRADSMRAGNAGDEATEFYGLNREAMDAGAVIAWPERFNHDELSAVQHAMNLKLQDEAAFFAEYQNEPLPADTADEDELTAEQICTKFNRMARGAVPIGCEHLTMFVDVQATLLFFVVAAWEDDFTGYVVDYGTFPDQRRQYFTLRDARLTLTAATKAAGLEGAIYAGLEHLTRQYLAREWRRDDGAALRIGRCLVDANWGSSTDVVYQFCRQSAHASVVMPSHGRFVGASSQPFSEYKRRPGDRVGHNWRTPNVQGKRAVRHVLFDTNYWKSFVHARLAVAMGDKGCLSIFGDKPEQHRLFAEHVTAEYRVRTEGRGRTVDEWKLRPERGDNHWFDGLVGCAVAASMQGAVLEGTGGAAPARRARVSFAELQRGRRR